MDFTEINSRGKRRELLGRIDRQNSRFRTAKTIIIKFGLYASIVELKSAKNALNEVLKAGKRFKETGKLEDRARAGRPCMKKHVHPALLSRWKRLRPKQLQGPAVHVKLPDDWAHHHHIICPQYSSSNPSAVPIQIAIVP
ncbi:uncharacterized protein TNCV_3375411 [Trichonephila clavipes]|nr:uncharacterized protein TNCV_3375411 [Trichonephila clavipes]